MMPALLNPWMIGLGASALALPVAVHWLTRPKPLAFPLSTIRFVRQIVQQRRAMRRLRDILILLMRMLAISLLAYAFARPFLGSTALIAGGESGSAARIVALDDSLSMSAVSHGIAPFERARQRASTMLAYQSGMQANLIFAGPRPRPVFDHLTTNLAALRESLAAATPQPHALNIQQTINRAADMLAKTAPNLRRELVIVSDFQRSNWANVDFSPLPQDTLIQLESVAPTETSPNLALMGVTVQGRPEQGQSVKIEIEVGNFTSEAKKVQAEISLGEAVYPLAGMCPKGVRTSLAANVTLPHPAGWFSGEARLLHADDALPADDVRPFVVHVRAAPIYALITRESAKPQPTSSHFVERALLPFTPRAGAADSPSVLRLAPESADTKSLSSAGVILLDHPGKLSTETIEAVMTLVRHGRPMIYIAAEPLDATNLKLLSDAAGTDLKLPVDYSPAPAGLFRRDLFITDVKRDQAPFQIFGDDLPGVLAPLRFGGGLATTHREGGLSDDILATYSDHSAALVVTACGAGTVAVLNADLSSSNLPANPAFVPLLGELVNRLLTARQAAQTVTAGDPFAVYLPEEAGPAAGLSLVSSPAAPALGVLSEENGSVLWRSSIPLPPGIYEVTRGGQRVFALAATLPDAEADLTTLDSQLLKSRLAGGRRVDVHAADNDDDAARHDTTWGWLLAACVVCLTMELFILRGFKT